VDRLRVQAGGAREVLVKIEVRRPGHPVENAAGLPRYVAMFLSTCSAIERSANWVAYTTRNLVLSAPGPNTSEKICAMRTVRLPTR
jgi:hypothetical protein